MIDLKARPFYLNEEQIKWVQDTLSQMTLEQKCGQIFCALGLNDNEFYLRHLINDIGIGGMMYRSGPAAYIQATHKKIQSYAKIPLLLAANTEAGGNGLAFEGTDFGSPMAVAATNDVENAYRMGYVATKEGAALGLTWSFAPIIDIDLNFHNPITNVRTFGSDPEMVYKCASAYLRGAKENNVAVTIKHFPGDGVDERDQHIVTSINSLSVEEWMKTYGMVYKRLIDEDAQTLMVGHIAFPEWVKKVNKDASKKAIVAPASLSKEIVTSLLREELGFNGLVSTDSSTMIGYMVGCPRSEGIPTSIEAGVDMILFTKNPDEDLKFLLEGVKNGLCSVKRIDEAVTRILATKAALNLPEKQAKDLLIPGDESLSAVGNETHKMWAKEVADKAVTLVKDDQNLLPLSVKKYKRVYLNVIQKELTPNTRLENMWKEKFEKEGFEVTVRNRSVTISPFDLGNPNISDDKKQLIAELYHSIEDTKKQYDLYVYVVNMQNASNNTTLRLNWSVMFGLGDDAPWFVREVPTMMISVACPYHLYDASMIDTYINAYAASPQITDAVMDKIMGRSEFKGISPVDPFCGNKWLK